MKDHFRRSMAWLHTWAGLLLGWVLYFMFITGTAGYVDTEIDRWMVPELPRAGAAFDPLAATRLAQASLAENAGADAGSWWIDYPVGRDKPYLQIWWESKEDGWRDRRLDGASGEPLVGRDTAGGQTLYRMHWKLHYLPKVASDWIVGVATLFMFVALVTGVIVHKKIFADFFTFRPGKGQRSWLDAHNVASVVTLPFQLMITWSGLIFMMFIYMPLVIAAWYGPGEEGRQLFLDDVFEPPALIDARGEPAPLVALDAVVAAAQRRWGGAPIASLEVRHPNDAHARIVVRGDSAAGPLRAADVLVFDGVSGALLGEQPALHSPAKGFRDLMLGLHEGPFAGPLLRALYVLSGLLGAAMIATGLVLWVVKRRKQQEKARQAPHFGLRLVERLNVATVIGLPVAIAAYFWSNRLLPLDLADRAEWEVHTLFLVWLALFVHASLRPAACAWAEQSRLAAAAFALLPVVNALTTERHLGASLPAGDWVFAGFDLAMPAFALVFLAIARRLGPRARSAGAEPGTMPSAAPGKQAGLAE